MLTVSTTTLEGRDPGGGGWLGAGMRESLLEINREGLALFAEQAAATLPPHPTLRQIGDLLRMLDEPSRTRAASCPFLLVGAGFEELSGAQPGRLIRVADAPAAPAAARAQPLARAVFVYAWTLVRTQPAAARLVLGIHPLCAQWLAERTVTQVHALAELQGEALRPRWPSRTGLWRELLQAAARADAPALERAHMHGVRLIAGEAWGAVPERPRPRATPARAASLTAA